MLLFWVWLFLATSCEVQSLECKQPIYPDYCILKDLAPKEFPPGAVPLEVHMDMGLYEVASVDDLKLIISSRMFVYMNWVDTRIIHTKKVGEDLAKMDMETKKTIFIPELYIYDLIKFESPEVITKMDAITVANNSVLSYYFEGQLSTVCDMDFRMYPMDTQTCKIRFGSIMHLDTEIVFTGSVNDGSLKQRALQYSSTVRMMPDNERVYTSPKLGNFSLTGIDILLTRSKTSFFLQFYLPSLMFVFISWVSFIIPHNSGERTGMIVTVLLVVVSMYLAVVASSPKATTLTAIELWFISCIGFIFLSLIELGIVMQIIAYYDRETKDRIMFGSLFNWKRSNVKILNVGKTLKDISTVTSPKVLAMEDSLRLSSNKAKDQNKESLGVDGKKSIKFTLGETQSHKLDRASLIVFPSSFLLFMIGYWNYYAA